MKILSIIIPSYNTSKFIDKCIPTFISESIVDWLEILMIDDGSTDDTLEKAKSYQEKYPTCIKVITKENGGHGSAVNTGIENSTGKYIRVVDGDDWVETDNLRKLIDYLSDCNFDVVLTPYYEVNQSKNFRKKLIDLPMEAGDYQFNQIVGRLKQFTIHMTTVRADILNSLPQKFTEKCFYDDFEFDMFIVPYVQNIGMFDEPVYDYLVGQKNQSVSKASALKNHMMMRTIIADSVRYFKHCKADRVYKRYMWENIMTISRSAYNIYLRSYNAEGAYDLLLSYDAFLKELSPRLQKAVIGQNKYITMALESKRKFKIVGMVFNAYKLVGSYN
jgi:glycosyltransferase involved in cell wall biosynthesis